MRRGMMKWASGLVAACAMAVAAAGQTARTVEAENLLLMDTRFGPIVIELQPQFAPRHVAQIKTLARQGFYDGLTFHRVIADFMAQGGDPTGTGAGSSDLPDIPAEFTARIPIGGEATLIGSIRDGLLTVDGRVYNSVSGAAIRGQFPAGGGDISLWRGLLLFHEPAGLAMLTGDGRVTANIQHCPGVASMARANPPDSANSQFFLMRGPSPWLDRQYSAWGRVVYGLDAVMALAIGEPPASPDRMRSVRVVADLPATERPTVRQNPAADAAALQQALQTLAGGEDSRDFNLCALMPPAEVRWPEGAQPNDPLAAMRRP